MNRFERWFRLKVLRQSQAYGTVTVGDQSQPCEFVNGKNVEDIVFSPITAGTYDKAYIGLPDGWVEVDLRAKEAPVVNLSGPPTFRITTTPEETA